MSNNGVAINTYLNSLANLRRQYQDMWCEVRCATRMAPGVSEVSLYIQREKEILAEITKLSQNPPMGEGLIYLLVDACNSLENRFRASQSTLEKLDILLKETITCLSKNNSKSNSPSLMLWVLLGTTLMNFLLCACSVAINVMR